MDKKVRYLKIRAKLVMGKLPLQDTATNAKGLTLILINNQLTAGQPGVPLPTP